MKPVRYEARYFQRDFRIYDHDHFQLVKSLRGAAINPATCWDQSRMASALVEIVVVAIGCSNASGDVVLWF
jgi:hypothetical protein